MFEKIPSLKDFIIYFIPGVIICYFGLNILTLLGVKYSISVSDISKDSALSFIGIIFSFLIGFLMSQIQIILFNLFINRNDSVIRTLNSTSISEDFKNKTAQNILNIFQGTSLSVDEIKSDPQILHLCLNYVKIKTNEGSNLFIDRASNLSSFASTLNIPLLLACWNYLLCLNIKGWHIFIVLFLFALLCLIITMKISYNFRKEWINSVYKQFLILSEH